MKKRILIGSVLILTLLAGAHTVPQMIESTIPSIYYVTPAVKTYENVVNCTGTVQSEIMQEVYLQSAIVAEEVLVEIGDLVREGDTLLIIDQEKTDTLSSLIAGVPTELIPVGSDFSGVDITSIMTAYGLSSIFDIDLGGITDILGQGKQESTENATAAVLMEAATEITAPISGVVTSVNIISNMPVAGGKAIFTISDTSKYIVTVAVDEGDISKINLGDEAKIRGVGFAGSSYQGVVSKIYPTARKALTGTMSDTVVDVEIVLLNPDSNLKHGFSAKVEIIGGNHYDIITVPYEAIRQDENNVEYVYTYADGKLHKTTITTGKELTNEVEILDGLDYDSVVIFNPDDVSKEGTMIQIKGRANVN